MNSNKRIITESQLRNIISESVKKVLEEAEVEPSKLAQGYYDVNKITKPDFSVGDEFDTGLSSHPFGHHISYKGQQIGSKLQGGRNLGRDYTFSAPDVDYGNQDGWGRMKWFDRADDYETYVEQNWARIKELLDTGVDFD